MAISEFIEFSRAASKQMESDKLATRARGEMFRVCVICCDMVVLNKLKINVDCARCVGVCICAVMFSLGDFIDIIYSFIFTCVLAFLDSEGISFKSVYSGRHQSKTIV